MSLTEEQRKEVMRKRLSARLNNSDHTDEGWSRLLLEVDALECRLAEAEKERERLKRDYDKSINEIYDGLKQIDKLQYRLRAASELPKKWREEEISGDPNDEVALTARLNIRICANELEAALKGRV